MIPIPILLSRNCRAFRQRPDHVTDLFTLAWTPDGGLAVRQNTAMDCIASPASEQHRTRPISRAQCLTVDVD